jgi:hypothetical protein
MNTARELLFLLIEVLPVLVKLLTLVGKPGLYDRILTDDENLLEERATNERNVARQLEGHRAAEQIRLGKIANQLLVDKQAEIARRAIDVWGQVATQRSDQALAQWYANYAGPGAPPPTVTLSTTKPATTAGTTTPPAPAAAAPTAYQQYRAQRLGTSAGNGNHPTGSTEP